MASWQSMLTRDGSNSTKACTQSWIVIPNPAHVWIPWLNSPWALKECKNTNMPDINFVNIPLYMSSSMKPSSDFIPCLLVPSRAFSDQLIVYFHSNGENLEQAAVLVRRIVKKLHMSAIIVEYPGYGMHMGKPCEESILATSEWVMQFIMRVLNFSLWDVFVFGRSIGSGPAVHLAYKYPHIGGLILISPMWSIR